MSTAHRNSRVVGNSVVGIFAALVASCGRAPHPESDVPTRRYGDLMAEVGRRFERSGRAVLADRWELASYDLEELEECFERDLARATPPPEVKIDLRTLAKAYLEVHTALKNATGGRDRAVFAAKFERAATACNGCHEAAGKGYIVVPVRMGASVPVIDASGLPSVAHGGPQ